MRSVGAHPGLSEPVEEHERTERAGERDEHASEHVVAEEGASEQTDKRGIQRKERLGRRDRMVVPVLGDLEEEDAVPPCPDIRQVPEVVRVVEAVPVLDPRIVVALEDEQREHRGRPNGGSAPGEECRRRVGRKRRPQLASSLSGLRNPLTGGHGPRMILAWLRGSSR